MRLTEQLRVAREAGGITQASVSARSGIAVTNLSTIEAGKVDVRLSTLKRLLDALDLEVQLVPRDTPMTLESAVVQSERGRARLAAAGLSPSNPHARLNAKERQGIDVSVEREGCSDPVPEAPSVSLLARASAAAPGSIERQLLVAAAFCEVALDDAVLVGGTAVHLYTGSYRPTDIDLVGYWQDGYQERLAALGFTRGGRHWLIRFGDGEAIGVEVPDHRLFELAADRPVMLDLNPGRLAVISVNDLMIDRLLAATGGEPITFDEALRLAVAAYASINWTALEARSRDAARNGSLAGQALPKVLQRVRRAAVRALRQR